VLVLVAQPSQSCERAHLRVGPEAGLHVLYQHSILLSHALEQRGVLRERFHCAADRELGVVALRWGSHLVGEVLERDAGVMPFAHIRTL
jgi:hypothetical protein